MGEVFRTVDQRAWGIAMRAGILAENHVSSRAADGGRRPIIDLEHQSLLSGLAKYSPEAAPLRRR